MTRPVPIFVQRVPWRANLWEAHLGVSTAQAPGALLAGRRVAAAHFGVLEARVIVDVQPAKGDPNRAAVVASVHTPCNPVGWTVLLSGCAALVLGIAAIAYLGGAS